MYKPILLAVAFLGLASSALAQGSSGITTVGNTPGVSSYTVSANDSTIYCNNTTGNPFTINLPPVAQFGNRLLDIKNINSTGNQARCDIQANASANDTIDGSSAPMASGVITLGVQPQPTATPTPAATVFPAYQSRLLQADGTANPGGAGVWHILNGVNGTSVFARCIPSGPVTIAKVSIPLTAVIGSHTLPSVQPAVA